MDLFDLVAKITLDSSEYERGIKEAGGGAASFSSAWKKAGGIAVGAIGAATAAVAGLTKKAVDSYAEYEQLAGGVRKLYGDAADQVMKYAEEGYKTSGLSANKYMELATSFSASLINSLDGDSAKAAEQTDVAMRAISDNWNTFGGDLANIQNAYQGFAKGNFMMLDNLKLGYGGTRTEMQRLIEDANEYAKANGKAADLSMDSFSDIVTAIELIQEKQGIAGTTAKEAATTISGSINMTKAAWENLLAGFSNPDADITELTQTLIESVGTAAGNILPAIMQAFEGIGQAFEQILPELVAKIPEVLSSVGQPLLNAGAGLVASLVSGITQSAPLVISSAMELVGDLVLGIAQRLPDMIVAGVNMITSLLEGLGSGGDELGDKITEIIETLIKGLVDAAPEIGRAMLRLLKAAADAFSKINWITLGLKMMRGVLNGIRSITPNIISAVKSMVSSVLDALGFTGAVAKVTATFESIKTAISDKIESAKQKVSDVIEAIKGMFPFSLGKIFSFSVPSISIGSQSKNVGGKTATAPSFDVGWRHFRKAMDTPYMFTKPTIFDVAGDGSGDELMYGRANLMRDMREVVEDSTRGAGIINIYLNYDASNDANDMILDIANGVRRYKMVGAL